MNFFLKTTFKFLFLLTVLLPLTGFAQAPTPIDGVSISIEPETPAPGGSAVVKLVSYNIDLNSANIVWQVDGKTMAKGIGISKLTVKAPPIGKVSNIISIISTVDGKEIRKGINIKSSDTDLVWESSGFLPPFYKGKSLFSYQNKISITAIPHIQGTGGKEADPKTLLYKWTVNNRVMQNQSGYGKQTLVLKDDLPVDLSVEVEILSRDGNQKSVSGISLTPGEPSLSLYEEDPLYGVLYNRSLVGDVRLKNNEFSVVSVPFYFNINGKNDLSREWSINDIEQADLKNNESVTLRTSEDSEGKSTLSLDIRGVSNILQGAKDSINIFFNKKKVEENTTF